MRHPTPLLTAVALTCLSAAPAPAFVYLEHTYFSDRACREALAVLGGEVGGGDAGVAARYLALALVCPARWTGPYCARDVKQVEGHLNRPAEPPAEGGDHAVTLGDFAGLADHLVRFGPVRGLSRAGEVGLLEEVFAWMAAEPGGPGGLVDDVSEEACDDVEGVPWGQVELDVRAVLEASAAGGRLPGVPAALLSPMARVPLPPGPEDPDALYTFDNPHFLDLRLWDHIHFGRLAHETWRGYHAVAVDVAGRRCPAVLGLDADELEDLAVEVSGFAEVDWASLAPAERADRGCRLLGELVRRRLIEWAANADPALVAPVAGWLDHLRAGPAADPETAALLDGVVAGVMGIVFEGAGLHFLQDGLAGGHLRLDRTAHGLAASRHAHDTDGDRGLAARFVSPAGETDFVAFGDGRMLGPSLAAPASCDPGAVTGADPAVLSACLLRLQRGIVVAAGAASLVDWALGGRFYEPPAVDDAACAGRPPAEAFACRHLPTRPPAALAAAAAGPPPATLTRGDLPPLPPPFGYESLVGILGIDGAGDRLTLGSRLQIAGELDRWADWMSSYDIGVLATFGAGAPPQALLELGYTFHWRWAARFVLHAGPFVYGALDGFGADIVVATGAGPTAGVTFLPEGWTHIPLAVSFGYRLPLRFADSERGWFGDAFGIEAHWIDLTLGFTFM